MRFESIAVVAAVSAAAEGEETSFNLSKRAQDPKEPIEAFSGPRNGDGRFFGDKHKPRALSNDRMRQLSAESTNLQSHNSKGTASADADIGILASTSRSNIHPRLQERIRRLSTSTVTGAEVNPRRFLEELYEDSTTCQYGAEFINRDRILEALSRPLAYGVEYYCSHVAADACNTCEVTNLYKDGAISAYNISIDCPTEDYSSTLFYASEGSPLFYACEGLGLGFGLGYDDNKQVCAICNLDVETNSVDMRNCNIANIGYNIDTVFYNKGYREFYVDTQFFSINRIADSAEDFCYNYYSACSSCGATFIYDPETGEPTGSYEFEIDCSNAPSYDFSYGNVEFFLKGSCECGICESCNVDAEKQLVEFLDCNISRATEEFYKSYKEDVDSYCSSCEIVTLPNNSRPESPRLAWSCPLPKKLQDNGFPPQYWDEMCTCHLCETCIARGFGSRFYESELESHCPRTAALTAAPVESVAPANEASLAEAPAAFNGGGAVLIAMMAACMVSIEFVLFE